MFDTIRASGSDSTAPDSNISLIEAACLKPLVCTNKRPNYSAARNTLRAILHDQLMFQRLIGATMDTCVCIECQNFKLYVI
jgi:hypothetical protein